MQNAQRWMNPTMPFGNSGFPVGNASGKIRAVHHSSHQCLSAIRVSPSKGELVKLNDTYQKSPMPFGNSGFPVYKAGYYLF